MIRYIFSLLVNLVILMHLSYAQDCNPGQLVLHNVTASEAEVYYLQYSGKPFIYENWLNGNIGLVTGEVIKDYNLKVDIYRGEVLYYNKILNKQLVIDQQIIDFIEFNDVQADDYIKNYVSYDEQGKASYELYFVLLSDSISLWCKKDKEVNVNTEFSSSYAKLGTFYQKNKYFIIKNDEFIRFPLRKRKLASYFPLIKKELITYIRKNQYDISRDDHLIKIFEEINRLL